MPAAAVIPAPIAYVNIVAVKKLVVGPLVGEAVSVSGGFGRRLFERSFFISHLSRGSAAFGLPRSRLSLRVN